MRNIGFELEKQLHEKIIKYIPDSIRETAIKQKYGTNTSGVDHVIIYGDKIFCIQCKWTTGATAIKDTNHFIQSAENINMHENKQLHGLLVSKHKCAKTSKAALDDKNFKNIHNNKSIMNLTANHNKDTMNKILVIAENGTFVSKTTKKEEKETPLRKKIKNKSTDVKN